MPWHTEMIRWRNEYLDHIEFRYDVWSNQKWLDWWCRGYRLAKDIRQLLPSDVELYYSEKEQCYEVLAGDEKFWCLNSGGNPVRLCPDMDQKEDAGLFIPRTHTDLTYEQDEYRNYKFVVSHTEHHLFP